jgi:anti-anti-sigma factor
MARPGDLEIREQAATPTAVLAVVGELDMNTVDLLAGEVDQHLAQGARSVKLDLGELGFMDSSGLRLLIELYDRSQSEHWQLTLVPPRSEAATMVLRATGADDALPFESNGDG